MLWIDWDFDYNDQLARKYMKFKGEYYDVGTIAKIKGRNGPVLARFVGWRYENKGCFEAIDGDSFFDLYDTYNCAGVMDYCLEIVVPVKPNLEQAETQASAGGFGLPEREKSPSWNIDIGWIWYILILAVGAIFKERVLIWVFATIVFFLWKKGFLRGGKK